MSYLTRPTVMFTGTFQADVPTENNHPSFVEDPPGNQNTFGRNWNPVGGGAFRLLDCAVDRVLDDPTADDDPILGAGVGGAHDRVSAKIVDLDPQWQGASELWGLRLEIVADGVVLLAGEFDPAAFRDSWATGQGLRFVQARFQSVLHDVTWAPAGTSATIDRLRAATSGGLLSVRMATHSFGGPGRTLGRLAGAIGPYRLGEPRRFVAGRRFTPAATRELGEFDAELQDGGGRLTVDLATAVPWTDPATPVGPVGPVRLGVLDEPDTAEGAAVTVGTDVHLLGEPLPLSATWLAATGGIAAVDVPAELRQTVTNRPLALVRGTGAAQRVLVRETEGGWLVRADHENLRADAGTPAATSVHVSCYGLPKRDVTPTVRVQGPVVPGGQPGEPAQPPTGTPEGVVTVRTVEPTGEDGWTELHLDCGDPGGPRRPIDGQVYFLGIGIPHPAPPEAMVVLVFDAYADPPDPTWEDHVLDILTPYAELYPAMTERLFDMRDYDQVRDRRAILQLALSLPVTDPNSMPVTRDLSGPKRATLLRWLALSDLPRRPAVPSAARTGPAPSGTPADVVDVDAGDAPFIGKQAAREQMRAVLLEEPS